MMIRLILFCTFILLALPVQAETPDAAQQKLQQVEQKIESQKAARNDIAKKLEGLQEELNELRSAIVGKATRLKSQERKVTGLENKIRDLDVQKQIILGVLKQEQSKLADLILALTRIRRTPPEALIAKPGAPLQAAQTAMILRGIVDPIEKKTRELKEKLEELDSIESSLRLEKELLSTQSGKLDLDQKKLDELIERRKALYEATRTDLKQQDIEISALSVQAANVRDLIRKLDERRAAAPEKPKKDSNKGRTLLPKSFGSVQPPISGVVRVNYGGTSDWGTRSEGVVIEGRKGGVVVAPMNGVVRYTGPFKSYGNLVIIEHSGGYHSLVAGLGKIDTVVGARVDAGEPLGNLSATAKGRPDIYFELRQNGQPINPSRQFPDLG